MLDVCRRESLEGDVVVNVVVWTGILSLGSAAWRDAVISIAYALDVP